MDCFVLSKDLMFSSQVAGAAAAAGCNSKTVGRAEQISAEGTHLVLLDLTQAGLVIDDVISRLKESAAIIVAIGPHVHEDKLNTAREAGADFVLTKGQASRELASLLSGVVEQKG